MGERDEASRVAEEAPAAQGGQGQLRREPGGDPRGEAADHPAVEAEHGVRVYTRLLREAEPCNDDAGGEGDAVVALREHVFEWCLGSTLDEVDDETVVEIWTAFFRALHDAAESESNGH